MNIIMIMTDTWRADYLGCYGNKEIKTPNLDQFASESVVFTNCYAEALPTIPMRKVIYTGKSLLPFDEIKAGEGPVLGARGWQPLGNNEVTFAEVAKKHNYTTGLIVDCYHFFKPTMNLHRGFDSWEWIRGQESDKWRSGPRENVDPKNHIPEHLRNENYDELMRQYLMNTADRQSEEDYFCARSCRAAMRWLEHNINNRPFALWVEMFDPHEPWDAPERFQKMYYDNYPCERFLFGYGARHADIREEDLPAIRGLYAAEVTFSDRWIGRLLEKIDDLGLYDDTIVVFTTDHGTHLGEQGCVQKTPGLLNSCVAQIPLIVHHPDRQLAGKRIDALVSGIDYAPTFLSMLNIEPPEEMEGRNFWSLVTGESDAIHKRIFSGFGPFAAVRDLEWHYFQNIKGNNPGKGPCLYDLKNDRSETTNVVDKYPDVVAAMQRYLAEKFEVPLLM